MNSIIQVKGLSKKYKIREKQSYHSLRDTLATLLTNPLKIINKKEEIFWALKDISFEVKAGEVLGIIGKNGAGKSTLLKILSKITHPTHGEIYLGGRVASLLEVGTGFHPELTGKENIFLNGAILGMTKKEIKSKYEEIVAFSEIEKFIDTPVKFYSSGMYTRLAFAVAAHLEPEILIVDEVLAVGDTEFQKKCLGKMQQVGKEGRTVLFVSHNLAAVNSLCQRVVLLKEGKIDFIGDTDKAISRYLMTHPKDIRQPKGSLAKQAIRLMSTKAVSINNKNLKSFDIKQPINIEITYSILKEDVAVAANVQISNSSGILLFNSPEDISGKWKEKIRQKGNYKSICTIPGNLLAEGIFNVRVTLAGIHHGRTFEIDLPDAIIFSTNHKPRGKYTKEKQSSDFPGVIRPKLNWMTK